MANSRDKASPREVLGSEAAAEKRSRPQVRLVIILGRKDNTRWWRLHFRLAQHRELLSPLDNGYSSRRGKGGLQETALRRPLAWTRADRRSIGNATEEGASLFQSSVTHRRYLWPTIHASPKQELR